MTATIKFELTGALRIIQDEPSKAGVLVTVRYDNFTLRAKGNDMAYTLPADKAIKVRVDYVDAKGNPAEVQSVQWSSSDNSIIVVQGDASDDHQAMVTPGPTIGQAQVVAMADVDLGEGVKPLNTMMDVTVVSGEAVAGTITPVGDQIPAGSAMPVGRKR